MSRENVEVVRRTFEVGVRDVDALLEFFDPAVEWVPVPQSLLAGESYRGHDGVRRLWEDLFSAWEKYEAEALDYRDLGDQVAVITRIRARSAHGLELDEVWSALFTLKAAKIIRFQGFADRAGALAAATR